MVTVQDKTTKMQYWSKLGEVRDDYKKVWVALSINAEAWKQKWKIGAN